MSKRVGTHVAIVKIEPKVKERANLAGMITTNGSVAKA